MMLFTFPAVGLIAGAIWLAAALLLGFLPPALYALVLAAVPWLVTGFMHLDGYMDVCDAVMSRKDLEVKRKILKDSHCGAFAVICILLLGMGQWAAFLDLGSRIREMPSALSLLLIPVTVRACAAMAVMGLKPMGTSQYSRMGGGSGLYRNLIRILAVLLALLIGGSALWLHSPGPAAAAAGYALAARYGCRQLDGMNGDISGFALSLGELAGVAALALCRF